MSRYRKLALIAVGLSLAALAFEACLQAIAYFRWRHAHSGVAAVRTDDRPCVLCVGDSYTYGLGAEDPQQQSYPAVLQRDLDAAAPGAWRVATDAWPGRNSRELLLRLPDQLRRARPAMLFVLVGMNDLWRATPEVTDDELAASRGADDGFPLVWRTGRLLALVAQWAGGAAPQRPADGPEFLGTWVAADGRELTFFRNGQLLFAPNVWQWHVAAGGIEIRDGGVPLRTLRWQRDGDVLQLESDDWDEPLRLRRGRTSPEIAAEAEGAEMGESLELGGAAQGGAPGERPIDAVTRRMGPELENKRAVLARHLEKIVRLARASGAEPVLLSYPWNVHGVAGVAEKVAASTGARYLSLLPHFDRLLETEPSEELYIADGHCTARGYAEMAGVVAHEVLAHH